jgi:hypothetical protein
VHRPELLFSANLIAMRLRIAAENVPSFRPNKVISSRNATLTLPYTRGTELIHNLLAKRHWCQMYGDQPQPRFLTRPSATGGSIVR